MERKRLYILCACILPLMICTGLVYSMYSLYLAEVLGAPKSHIGLIYMVGAAMGLVSGPFLGKLSDRLGRKPVILAAMGSFTLIFILYATIRSYVVVYPIQILEGAAWVAIGATATAYIADIVAHEERGWAMGVYQPDRLHWLDDWAGFRRVSLRPYWLAAHLSARGNTGDYWLPSGLDTGQRTTAATSEHQEEQPVNQGVDNSQWRPYLDEFQEGESFA